MNRWQNRLLAAAVTAMSFGPPVAATAQADNNKRPVEVTQGNLIDQSLLDDQVIGDVAAQRRIIQAAANDLANPDQQLDAMGLTRRAAHALTSLLNQGDLPGATNGQDPLDWWQGAEAKIKEHVADQKLADAIMGGILVAGLAGMGRALMVGNIDGNQPARRREQVGAEAAKSASPGVAPKP
ncbi:MAG: hypothetical protein AAF556_06635 [Pseudomonadota bacterium]